MDFFKFLEEKYPLEWDKLNQFYADNCENLDCEYLSPRMAKRGWDDLLKVENFGFFLQAIKSIWIDLTGENYGICEFCQEERELETEHRIIVSFEFGPVVKCYENFEMDGSMFSEILCCRNCAHIMYQKLADKMNAEKAICWV